MIFRILLGALKGVGVITCAAVVLVHCSAAPSARDAVRTDADTMLSLLTTSDTCGGRCRVQVLDNTANGTWRVRLSTPSWVRCFAVTPAMFSFSADHGAEGVLSDQCPRPSHQLQLESLQEPER